MSKTATKYASEVRERAVQTLNERGKKAEADAGGCRTAMRR
jgi:hypothetical protein